MADTSIKCPTCRQETKFLSKIFIKTECSVCLEDCDTMCSLICRHCFCEECSIRIGLYKPKEEQLSVKELAIVVDEIEKQKKKKKDMNIINEINKIKSNGLIKNNMITPRDFSSLYPSNYITPGVIREYFSREYFSDDDVDEVD